MNSIASIGLRFGSALTLALALSSAQATVIDFSGSPEGGVFTNPTGSGNGPSLYVTQGFEFAATGPDGHVHQNIGSSSSVYMHSNYGDTTTNTWVLSEVGGGAFDLTSFDLLGGALNWVTDLGLTGATTLGTNAVNLTGLHAVTFSLQNGNGFGELGGFVVNANAVPEPAALALVLAGLGAMGLSKRRAKQAAAA